MKYRDLIHFEPITSVVKLVNAGDVSIAESLVKTFVFSQKIKEDMQEVIIKNLIPNASYETKGIQIVGSYGTGKSHLMSLVSAIAENEGLLKHIAYEDIRQSLEKIAGRYKVLRFEIGTDRPLKEIVFTHIERYLYSQGIEFAFDDSSIDSWKVQLAKMMSVFETHFPKHHFLIVIDELLEYLKGRRPTELNNDLMLLRQLGEACDNSRFRLMFGVQELLYRSPEFQFQAEMLNKIEDRYADLIITKEDVSFVVKERLLKKDLHQKHAIREHLIRFAYLFEGINTNLNEYVDLFPVHPNYISYFERIKHGKSQREILKVLSSEFSNILDRNVPTNDLGLITYDTYWKDLSQNPAMLTFPDIRTVKDKVEIIEDRIKNHFTGARANRKELAKKIAHALAIRILCDDLDKKNGATAQSLKEDICSTLSNVNDPDLLLAAIENTSNQLLTATAGQYVDQNPVSGEFYIRTVGGINIPQLIRDYADEVIKRSPEQADQYYYDFLQYVLGLQQNTYRTGFKIWQHSLQWIDKKSFRLGYIFFGNPNERSTTEPIQQFYIFFCPIFSSIQRNDEPDEVYFEMKELSSEFKDIICLYGAAKAKEASASSDQKQLFRSLIEEHLKKAMTIFDKEYIDKTQVIYKGKAKPLKSYPLLGEGSTKEMIFSDVVARVLNNHFNDKVPYYPAFKDLLQPLTKDNFDGRIKNALKKIINPSQPNRDGEAILSGLGLWSGQGIDTQNSRYADSIIQKLKEQGEGVVLNKNDIIYAHYSPHNLWYSVDYNLDHQLQFLVLAVLAYKGDIEILWSGNKSISATNIERLQNLTDEDFFTYAYIKEPQGMPLKNLKALFSCLGLPDLTSDIQKPETITKIITEAKSRVERVVKTKAIISQGLRCRNLALLSDEQAQKMKTELEALSNLLDGILAYNTFGKLKSFKYTEEELKQTFTAWQYCEIVKSLKDRADRFERLIGYLYTAQSYVVEGEKPLYDDISSAINELGKVLTSGKEAEIKKYEALLNSLIDRYADYYLSQYTKCRLSVQDARRKDRIMSSEAKRICDIIKDSEFITATEYQNWINSITSLREADTTLTKARVKEEPYHDFNPREYYGKPNFKVHELAEQLEAILDKWVYAMRSVFKDPSVQVNLELLKPADRKLVQDFKDNKISLNEGNAVKLRNLISQLAQGIDKVEISLEDLKRQIDKPLTPQEAIDTITEYINSLCLGKERGKVRIIVR